MVQVAGYAEDEATAGYDQILMHLNPALIVANKLGDKEALALLDMLQHLCLTRARTIGESSRKKTGLDSTCIPTVSLSVHLFGAFQSFLNGVQINGWRKKSKAVFKYLVVYRIVPVHRDKLLDVFWPNTDPQAARNCLNVTLHALRCSLKSASGSHSVDEVVTCAHDHYRLHPEMNVWADTDAFREQVDHAQAAAIRGDRSRAITHYELATTLYRGHFLEEDLYEEWTISPRERLRSSYIALLTHLSQLYYETSNFLAALDCSQKILEHDNCCEYAHRLIMCCYYALGQRSLAVRQYFISRDILDRELQLPPMEATTHLYEQIIQDDVHALDQFKLNLSGL